MRDAALGMPSFSPNWEFLQIPIVAAPTAPPAMQYPSSCHCFHKQEYPVPPRPCPRFAVPVLSLAVLLSAGFALSAAPRPLLAEAKETAKSAPVVLDRVTSAHPLPNGIEIRSGLAVMQVLAVRDDLLRVRVGATGTLPEDASWAVLAASRTASVSVKPDANEKSV